MDQVPKYSGGLANVDTNNTKNAIVQRDANKQINISIANCATKVIAPISNVESETFTATANITGAAEIVLLDATAGAFTATLPPAASCPGLKLRVIKKDSSGNLPTVQGNASEVIYTPGASGNTYTGLTSRGKTLLLYCDEGGTFWWGGALA